MSSRFTAYLYPDRTCLMAIGLGQRRQHWEIGLGVESAPRDNQACPSGEGHPTVAVSSARG